MWYWDFSADSGLDARLDEARRGRFLGYARNDMMGRLVHAPLRLATLVASPFVPVSGCDRLRTFPPLTGEPVSVLWIPAFAGMTV